GRSGTPPGRCPAIWPSRSQKACGRTNCSAPRRRSAASRKPASDRQAASAGRTCPSIRGKPSRTCPGTDGPFPKTYPLTELLLICTVFISTVSEVRRDAHTTNVHDRRRAGPVGAPAVLVLRRSLGRPSVWSGGYAGRHGGPVDRRHAAARSPHRQDGGGPGPRPRPLTSADSRQPFPPGSDPPANSRALTRPGARLSPPAAGGSLPGGGPPDGGGAAAYTLQRPFRSNSTLSASSGVMFRGSSRASSFRSASSGANSDSCWARLPLLLGAMAREPSSCSNSSSARCSTPRGSPASLATWMP